PQITSSFATSSRIERKESPTQSITTPTGKETGKASLQNPQPGTSFSDAPTGSCGETDTKWVEHDEITATNFDLSHFWRIENFANLEGAEAVESEDRF
ncbi:Uncharacterized protein APZ42_009547, partial [Daphnia magna]